MPRRQPSPYGRQVAASISSLLRLFADHVADSKSNVLVLRLATSDDWSSAHQMRMSIRDKYLKAAKTNEHLKTIQYLFEESCLETLYNDTNPDNAFDAISPYWVVPNALRLSQALSLPLGDVLVAMRPTA